MKRFIKILTFIIILGHGTYQYFFYIDLKNNCKIFIAPSLLEFNNLTIKRAINPLRYAAPDDYTNLCKRVDVIDPNFACGGFEGGCFESSQPRTIIIDTSQRSMAWASAMITHEVCHAIQYHESRQMDEHECYVKTDEVLRKIVEL